MTNTSNWLVDTQNNILCPAHMGAQSWYCFTQFASQQVAVCRLTIVNMKTNKKT